jgi:cytochrome c5
VTIVRYPKIATRSASRLAVAASIAGLACYGGAIAQEVAATSEQAPPKFTEEMLTNQHNIDVGRAIWEDQCTHCHGAKAYPGKAHKLKPSRYKPEFVFHRVSKGFRAMPAWGEIYTQDEIVGIVAYVKSKQFSP